MKKTLSILFTAVLTTASMQLCAAQSIFKRDVQDDFIKYHYQWQDHQNNQQVLNFELDAQEQASLPSQQVNYKATVAMRYVTRELLKHAKTIDPRKARVRVQQKGEEVSIELRSQDPQMMNDLQQDMHNRKENAWQHYLEQHYYESFNTLDGREAIKPAHTRYISEYTKHLIPAAQAFYELLPEGSDARDYMNMVLSWIQSIPYSTLEDRAESNGSGFSPPAMLLASNVGDCDSKSVLAASLIRAFLPDVPIRMVFLKNHALLAVAISQRAEDKVINENGLPLVLMEPTGPAPYAFGQIGADSATAIDSGQYLLETVP